MWKLSTNNVTEHHECILLHSFTALSSFVQSTQDRTRCGVGTYAGSHRQIELYIVVLYIRNPTISMCRVVVDS